MIFFYLEPSHGTTVTEEMNNAAEEAAMNVFGHCEKTAREAEKHYTMSCFGEKHDKTMSDLWYYAETVALMAACDGWHSLPEDLSLRFTD